MSTLVVMRKLTRQPGGQFQASSDPEIVRAVKRAHLDLADLKIVGDPIDQMALINAWLWGISRLPDPQRKVITEVLVKDLERWMLKQDTLDPDQILAALRQALCELPASGHPRIIGKHTVGEAVPVDKVFEPRDRRARRKAEGEKPGSKSHS